MKILILGSTGMLGAELSKAALQAGHEVVAFVRSPDKLGELAAHVEVIEGEYFDRVALGRAIVGVDSVLTTIGPPLQRRMRKSYRPGQYTEAMQSLIEAMEEASVRRIVAAGGAGLRLGDETLTFARALVRGVLRLMSGPAYAEKEAEHNELYHSSLDWTIVRPPQIAATRGTLRASLDKPPSMKADPQQLAAYMVSLLEDSSTVHRAPFVATV